MVALKISRPYCEKLPSYYVVTVYWHKSHFIQLKLLSIQSQWSSLKVHVSAELRWSQTRGPLNISI